MYRVLGLDCAPWHSADLLRGLRDMHGRAGNLARKAAIEKELAELLVRCGG
jgi:hypothetical protein